MTQLTFNQKSAFEKSQRPRLPDAYPHEKRVQGDADNYMARVSRNTQSGRRRHGSEQPDVQRTVRPKAEESGDTVKRSNARPQAHVQYHDGYEAELMHSSTVPFSEFMSTQDQPFRNVPIETRSPESYGSPSSLSFELGGFYHPSLHPINESSRFPSSNYTPNHSISSPYDNKSQDSVSAFLSLRTQTGSSIESNEDANLRYGVFQVLLFFLAVCSNLTRCR